MTENAERINGWAAMLGVIAAIGKLCNYWTTHSWYLVIPNTTE